MKTKKRYTGVGIALGTAIGAGIGSTTGDMGLWVGVGIALGVAIGAGMDHNQKKKAEKNDQQL